MSAQPVLMAFFSVSFQHSLMGTFSYTACFFTDCISSSRAFRTKIGSNRPPLASSHYFPSRIEFSSCTICPPSLLRLRFFRIWGVKSNCLTCVPLAMCIVEDAWHASPTCCRRPSRITESRFSRRLTPSTFLVNMWAVREEALSFSVTPVSCVGQRVEDIMPALQACYARKRELRCVAAEIV